MINCNELISIVEAARQHEITVAAVIRMESEGLLEILRLRNDYFLRLDEFRYVVELAREDSRYLTCTCIGGPCACHNT